MPDVKPVLNQLNLVVRDMDATLAFYRRLGLEIAEPMAWPPGSGAKHAGVKMPGGFTLEFDNLEMVRIWNKGFREEPRLSGGNVIGFAVDSRQTVDQLYTGLTEAGHRGVQPPYDAFWGARYAIVEDPDGHHVGLMSPIDTSLRYTPEAKG